MPEAGLSYYGAPAGSGTPLAVDYAGQAPWSSAVMHPTSPACLPSPVMVTRLIDAFFAKAHAGSGMVNERKFRQGMLHTPEHAEYPAACLVHAVLASAARIVSPGFYVGEKKYWGQGRQKDESLSDYHAQRAREMLENDFCKGHKLLQVTQASVLCCLQAYTSAKSVWFQLVPLAPGPVANLAFFLTQVRPSFPRRRKNGSAVPSTGTEPPQRGVDRLAAVQAQGVPAPAD